jgi:peptidoglycan/LPS O-acetylase OafA/YrhL
MDGVRRGSKRSSSGYLPTLDGWRAIAITAVLVDHGTIDFLRDSRWYHFLRLGPNGVSLFFAISGFLICSRLIEEEQLLGRINLKGFYIRRACRILPAAFTYLVVIALLGFAGFIAVSPLEWWSCVLFFRNYLSPEWIQPGWGGYTIHYWSLAVEEHFYMLWPGLLTILGRFRARYAAAGLAILVSIWRWWNVSHAWLDRHIPGLLFGSRTDIRLDGLLLGCLAALVLADPSWRNRFERYFTLPAWCGCAGAYVLSQVIPMRHAYSIWESALLAALVAGTVLEPHGIVGRFLESSAMKLIGRLSYSLYLWQQLFLIPGGKYPLSILQKFPLNLPMVFLAAGLSYKLVERPMIRLGHRLAQPPTPGRNDLEPDSPVRT